MLDKNLLAAVDRAVAAADMTRSGFIEEGLRIRLEVIRKVASFKIGSSRPANISPEFWERFLKNTYSTEMAANHIRSMSQNSVGKESEKTNTRRSGTRVFKHSKKA
jgi:hypothetical protein